MKSKKYVVPLAVVNPEVTAGLVVAYLMVGRFHAPKDVPSVMIPEDVERPAEGERSTELQRRNTDESTTATATKADATEGSSAPAVPAVPAALTVPATPPAQGVAP